MKHILLHISGFVADLMSISPFLGSRIDQSKMGAMESCCGKRRPADMPSMPTKPVSALGNQYVTFNPEQPELFIMRQKIWTSHQPFDVKDISLNDWFKIEGKDAQVCTSSFTVRAVLTCHRYGPANAFWLHSPARCIF